MKLISIVLSTMSIELVEKDLMHSLKHYYNKQFIKQSYLSQNDTDFSSIIYHEHTKKSSNFSLQKKQQLVAKKCYFVQQRKIATFFSSEKLLLFLEAKVYKMLLKKVAKCITTIGKMRQEIVAIPKTIKDHAIIRTLYLFKNATDFSSGIYHEH